MQLLSKPFHGMTILIAATSEISLPLGVSGDGGGTENLAWAPGLAVVTHDVMRNEFHTTSLLTPSSKTLQFYGMRNIALHGSFITCNYCQNHFMVWLSWLLPPVKSLYPTFGELVGQRRISLPSLSLVWSPGILPPCLSFSFLDHFFLLWSVSFSFFGRFHHLQFFVHFRRLLHQILQQNKLHFF